MSSKQCFSINMVIRLTNHYVMLLNIIVICKQIKVFRGMVVLLEGISRDLGFKFMTFSCIILQRELQNDFNLKYLKKMISFQEPCRKGNRDIELYSTRNSLTVVIFKASQRYHQCLLCILTFCCYATLCGVIGNEWLKFLMWLLNTNSINRSTKITTPLGTVGRERTSTPTERSE